MGTALRMWSTRRVPVRTEALWKEHRRLEQRVPGLRTARVGQAAYYPLACRKWLSRPTPSPPWPYCLLSQLQMAATLRSWLGRLKSSSSELRPCVPITIPNRAWRSSRGKIKAHASVCFGIRIFFAVFFLLLNAEENYSSIKTTSLCPFLFCHF